MCVCKDHLETGTAMKTGVIQGLTSINKSEFKKTCVCLSVCGGGEGVRE